MKAEKRKRLEHAGWRVSESKEFLNLTAGEAEVVEIKLSLARRVRELRAGHN
jgi:hypothetical protein